MVSGPARYNQPDSDSENGGGITPSASTSDEQQKSSPGAQRLRESLHRRPPLSQRGTRASPGRADIPSCLPCVGGPRTFPWHQGAVFPVGHTHRSPREQRSDVCFMTSQQRRCAGEREQIRNSGGSGWSSDAPGTPSPRRFWVGVCVTCVLPCGAPRPEISAVLLGKRCPSAPSRRPAQSSRRAVGPAPSQSLSSLHSPRLRSLVVVSEGIAHLKPP